MVSPPQQILVTVIVSDAQTPETVWSSPINATQSSLFHPLCCHREYVCLVLCFPVLISSNQIHTGLNEIKPSRTKAHCYPSTTGITTGNQKLSAVLTQNTTISTSLPFQAMNIQIGPKNIREIFIQMSLGMKEQGLCPGEEDGEMVTCPMGFPKRAAPPALHREGPELETWSLAPCCSSSLGFL